MLQAHYSALACSLSFLLYSSCRRTEQQQKNKKQTENVSQTENKQRTKSLVTNIRRLCVRQLLCWQGCESNCSKKSNSICFCTHDWVPNERKMWDETHAPKCMVLLLLMDAAACCCCCVWLRCWLLTSAYMLTDRELPFFNENPEGCV